MKKEKENEKRKNRYKSTKLKKIYKTKWGQKIKEQIVNTTTTTTATTKYKRNT